MKPRILAIDDESRWLNDFKAWIPKEVADQDSAPTTLSAVELLRRYHYDVVLLDLSMDLNNPYNRDNRAIQEYLATQPEGTQYIVISAKAEKTEVRDAAFHLNAFDVLFKTELEAEMLLEKVTLAIEEASRQSDQVVADAKMKLTDAGKLDGQILTALDPKGGNQTLYPMMDTLFHRIAPVAPHQNRRHFAIASDCVLGLLWSRRMGKALSIVLASIRMPEDDSRRALADWLGYAHEQEPMFSRKAHRVRIEYFEEPVVSDRHFELPLDTEIRS